MAKHLNTDITMYEFIQEYLGQKGFHDSVISHCSPLPSVEEPIKELKLYNKPEI
jgi:hypothetical protein